MLVKPQPYRNHFVHERHEKHEKHEKQSVFFSCFSWTRFILVFLKQCHGFHMSGLWKHIHYACFHQRIT